MNNSINKLNIDLNQSYNIYKKHKNIIVICAGDTSLHYKKKWFAKSRKYVLCVIYYGDDNIIENDYKNSSDIFIKNKGPKWSLIRQFLIKWKKWKTFNYIAFPDDDLDITVTKLNNLFKIGSKYKLNLYQPALIDNGPLYVKHNILKENKTCKLRYTDFVEIMIPIFSQYALKKSYKILTDRNIKSAWGVDYIIPTKILHKKNIAIIDSIPIKHTKPLGALNAQIKSSFYKTYNIDPEKELKYFLTKYKGRTYQQTVFKCIK